jgi:hypothetical protein
MTGRFCKKGVDIKSATKLIFPIDQDIASYKVKATSDSSLMLNWDGNFNGADKIIIEKSSPDPSNFQVTATISPTLKSYEAKNLDEVTPYYFRIKGENEFYTSSYFEGKDTTFISPQMALPATEVTPDSFIANWKYLLGTDSCLLQVSDNDFASFVTGYEGLIVKSGSKSISGLEQEKIYHYRVKRFKSNKASDFSNAIAVNIITGLEESQLKVEVYPNPVSDYLSINLPGTQQNANVIIHSVKGEIVANYQIEQTTSEIGLQSLPNGIYILTVTSAGNSKTFKLVRSK